MGPKGKSTGGKGKGAPLPEKGSKKGASEKVSAAPSGGKKKGGPVDSRPSAAPDKQSKAAKKQDREERERQRLADRDAMMNGMPSYDSDEEDNNKLHQVDFPGVSKKKAKDLTTDKFGNTVSKSKTSLQCHCCTFFIHAVT